MSRQGWIGGEPYAPSFRTPRSGDPESRRTLRALLLDSGLAPSARPGMTADMRLSLDTAPASGRARGRAWRVAPALARARGTVSVARGANTGRCQPPSRVQRQMLARPTAVRLAISP